MCHVQSDSSLKKRKCRKQYVCHTTRAARRPSNFPCCCCSLVFLLCEFVVGHALLLAGFVFCLSSFLPPLSLSPSYTCSHVTIYILIAHANKKTTTNFISISTDPPCPSLWLLAQRSSPPPGRLVPLLVRRYVSVGLPRLCGAGFPPLIAPAPAPAPAPPWMWMWMWM